MQVFRGIPEKSDRPVALTIGNFDGVHLGHQAVLARLVKQAQALGLLSCVMTFEPHPREFFDPQNAPARLTDVREKIALFSQIGIDRVHVCRFDEKFARMDARHFESVVSEQIGAKWVLIGDDFRYGARRAGDFVSMREAGRNRGFEVEAMHSVMLGEMRISSTLVRQALKSGDLEFAKKLLGRPYSIVGRVGHGKKLGKTIGFPTANIRLKHNKPPLSGIYVVEVDGLGEDPVRGVASLGVRPTVESSGKPVLEVYLFDFDRSIYGARLKIEFLAKLREEEKFPDLDSLVRQIGQDVLDARRYFES
ncbi:MAG: bifunctional riboflavin kinase/FAD synthetase [Burkholderiales bacterium]|nr:bifunctional riboflavin kinase/FAD synthetase [Burkholderiales bacterium]